MHKAYVNLKEKQSMSNKHNFIGRIIIASFIVICLILIMIFSTSCASMMSSSTDPIDEGTNALQNLMQEVNPETGEQYTLEEATELQEAANEIDEEKHWMDNLISTPIMIIFVITSIGMVIAGGIAFQKGNIPAAIAWALTGAAILCLPVLLIVFFKAMMFLLYVFYAVVITGLIGVVWFIIKKSHDKDTVITGLIGSVDLVLEGVEDETRVIFEKELKAKQCPVTKKAVRKDKGKAK